MAKLGYVLACLFPCSMVFWLCSIPVLWITPANVDETNPFDVPNRPFIGVTTRTYGDPWYEKPPPCPCSTNNLQSTVEEGWQVTELQPANFFHPGAATEMRIVGVKERPELVVGQQCMFDEAGQLITGGIAAGTPDKWSFYKGDNADLIGHTVFDVIPFLPAFVSYYSTVILEGDIGELYNNTTMTPELQSYLDSYPPSQGRDLDGNACQPCQALENGLCMDETTGDIPISDNPIRWVILAIAFILVPLLALRLLGLGISLLFQLLRWPFTFIGAM